MAGADKAAVAEVLKRVYDNYVIDMQNLEHRAIDEIGKSSKNYNAGGEGFFGAINDEGNESVESHSEGSCGPDPVLWTLGCSSSGRRRVFR
jgi:hypothetical protein